ncbi:HPr family phosphocarrier protein [Halalkalibacter okhensis]|uniref:PTS sorbose transporter subunit IIC n=1 Tax=Halalkalibacter okhensis TaxID=333138 RepID=A0A0B0IJF5_9BACI|nr:HPr family phosphocarrier protein [Halalkalibacter okhensis]KHF40199.1 PTS sorbose transporter subunit IIC [Halalkalibacter okhensis]
MRVKILQPILAETASQIVNKASEFPETILIKKDHWEVDAKSLLGLLAIALKPNQEIELEVHNSNESEEAIEALLSTGLFQKV